MCETVGHMSLLCKSSLFATRVSIADRVSHCDSPFTTFSPTQVVPIDLLLTPIQVESAKSRIFIRVGITRCQHVTYAEDDPKNPINELHENLVSARIGIFDLSDKSLLQDLWYMSPLDRRWHVAIRLLDLFRRGLSA
jgi:hypothetical protein